MLSLVAVAAQAAPPPKKNGRSSQRPAAAVSAEDLQALKDALAAQQQQIEAQQRQIDQLRQELGQKDANWRDAQQRATEAQGRLSAIESQNKQQLQEQVRSAQQAVAESANEAKQSQVQADLADVKTTLTNTAVTTQEEQKRVSALEALLGRFRLNGDARVRYENFFQGSVAADRHRARVRLRLGIDGKLSEDFLGGIYIASGDLTDPISTNQTLTGFFNRKQLGFDRGWITYKPQAHKWLELTGGKFAYTWNRTPLTFDNDLNPEGFSQRFTFDMRRGPLRNLSFTGIQVLINEAATGADSFAAGGQVSTKLQFGDRMAITPSVALLNWRNPDAIAAAVVSRALVGNANTNATSPDKNHFLSKFLYNDYIVDAQVKTPWSRLPLRLFVDYNKNLRAVCNAIVCGQDSALWGEVALGQTRERNDVQFGYSFARIEQDAVISQFNESDMRAPTNVLQHRALFLWQVRRNATLSYTLWIGRTLNPKLPNAAKAPNTAQGQPDPWLKRMQLDLIYKF